MATEPTEDSFDAARSLLAKAAATIDVDETAPMTLTGLSEPRPRRWPVLAAAAAVVLAVGGGYLVTRQLGDDPQLNPAPGNREPIEEESGLDDDQLPSLIGYTEDEAIELVQSRGYAVEVHVVPDGCNVAGIVTGTTPAVGTRMEPGDAVTLRVVGQQDVIDCVGELSWDTIWAVVRSAHGFDVAPEQLDGVAISPEVRDGLAQLLSQTWEGEGSPGIRARWTYLDDCPPQLVPGDDRLRIWVGTPKRVGADPCPPTSIFLRFDQRARLTAVELIDDAHPPGPADPSILRPMAADAFIAWARGNGPAPKFADRVRVMYGGGGAFGSTGWVDDPEDRSLYAGCSGLGFPDCGLDPVALLVRHQGQVGAGAGRSSCVDGGEVPERFAEAEEDVFHIELPEHCSDAWAVELWIDEDGVVYGVNQAGG